MIKVVPLKIATEFGDIFPCLILSGDELILVDAGYPGQADAIQQGIKNAGLPLDNLSSIVITHHDFDHVGSLQSLKEIFHPAIIATRLEADYLEWKQKPFRLQQAEVTYASLPEELKPQAKQFENLLRSIHPITPDRLVREGDMVDRAGQIMVIETPGHTEGHISLYIKKENTLIAGDALVFDGDHLLLANPEYAWSLDTAKKSAHKIKGLSPEQIICYHGGVCMHPTAKTFLI